MKRCPNCRELLGDSVDICFKCKYNYKYRRVITSDEFAKERIEQQQQNTELQQQREEQKKLQLSKNPLFEYQLIVINDLSDGQIDQKKIQDSLNEWSRAGWRLHSIFVNEMGKESKYSSFGGYGTGVNATIDQTVLVLERCIKSGIEV